MKKYGEDANAREKYKKLNGVLKMWLSAIKVAVQAGSKYTQIDSKNGCQRHNYYVERQARGSLPRQTS